MPQHWLKFLLQLKQIHTKYNPGPNHFFYKHRNTLLTHKQLQQTIASARTVQMCRTALLDNDIWTWQCAVCSHQPAANRKCQKQTERDRCCVSAAMHYSVLFPLALKSMHSRTSNLFFLQHFTLNSRYIYFHAQGGTNQKTQKNNIHSLTSIISGSITDKSALVFIQFIFTLTHSVTAPLHFVSLHIDL